jgi:hypothetical protein
VPPIKIGVGLSAVASRRKSGRASTMPQSLTQTNILKSIGFYSEMIGTDFRNSSGRSQLFQCSINLPAGFTNEKFLIMFQ